MKNRDFKLLCEQLILEGVYDPSIFKAIFMAGGPGSGKTWAAKKVAKGLGFKFVNSDTAFEFFMKKAGLSLKLPDEEYAQAMNIRDRAKAVTDKIEKAYELGRLGVVIDGTGRDFNKIKRKKDYVESLGYDSLMIYVNVPLEVSLQRNANRDRSVPEYVVREIWMSVTSNIGKFQTLFGSNNFIIIDSHKASDKIYSKIWKEVMKFSKTPPKNIIAKKWMSGELNQKRRR